MKRILLVNPATDAGVDNYSAVSNIGISSKQSLIAPLPLATIAALTPPCYNVEILDEAIHGPLHTDMDFRGYNLVGITGYQAHMKGAKRVARIARDQGCFVVVGGPGASSAPEHYRDDFDVVFVGEAEHTWRQFLTDWEAGSAKSEYRQILKPDMLVSPIPDWSALAPDMHRYFLGSVQTTRGCPFDCEFCDVIFLYGRKPRHKPVDQVLLEVSNLEKLGVEAVFFCDDNLIGDPKFAKSLLRSLNWLNNSFRTPLSYSTQITINVAKDSELLELLADANFDTLYIGVETPDKASLKEANKPQNVASDLVADIRRIQSYGLAVRAGLIVGFDHDNKDIFQTQFRFIQESCIPIATVNMLKAPFGTKVWSRLLAERRIIAANRDFGDEIDSMRYSQTNVVPKNMTRSELMAGQLELMELICDWGNFAERVKGFIQCVTRPPRIFRGAVSVEARIDAVERLLEALDGDPNAKQHALEILFFAQLKAPFMLPRVISMILQQVGVSGMMIGFRSESEAQVAREKTITDLGPYIDRRPILLSSAFREDYRTIFPEMYDYMAFRMTDHSRLPAAISEVFKDFLVRWGHDYTGLEAHHRLNLLEIADRVIAALPRDNNLSLPGEMVLDMRSQNQLRIEVLKVVERDLRGISDLARERPG